MVPGRFPVPPRPLPALCGLGVLCLGLWACGEGGGRGAADPQGAAQAQRVGADFLEKRKYPLAERSFERAVLLDPENHRARFQLGLARYEQTVVTFGGLNLDYRKLEAALGDFLGAIELEPDVAEYHRYAGLAQERAKDMEAAVAHFERSLVLDPTSVLTRVHLGRALVHAGRLDRAREELERAVREQPGFAAAHNELGLLGLEIGDWSMAVGAFEAVSRLEPDAADPWFCRSTALHRLGRSDEADLALAEYRRLKAAEEERQRPGGGLGAARQHFRRGTELMAKGRGDEALEAFRAVLELQPTSGAARLNIGIILLSRDDAEGARAELERSVEALPRNPQAWFHLARARAALGESRGAAEALRAALEIDPRHEGARELLAKMGGGGDG